MLASAVSWMFGPGKRQEHDMRDLKPSYLDINSGGDMKSYLLWVGFDLLGGILLKLELNCSKGCCESVITTCEDEGKIEVGGACIFVQSLDPCAPLCRMRKNAKTRVVTVLNWDFMIDNFEAYTDWCRFMNYCNSEIYVYRIDGQMLSWKMYQLETKIWWEVWCKVGSCVFMWFCFDCCIYNLDYSELTLVFRGGSRDNIGV